MARFVPVLVGGSIMPQSRDLPSDLAALVRRNALELSDTRFHDGATRLIAALRKALTPLPPPAPDDPETREPAAPMKQAKVQPPSYSTHQIFQTGNFTGGKAGRAEVSPELQALRGRLLAILRLRVQKPRERPARKAARRWTARLAEQGWGYRELRVRLSKDSHQVEFEHGGATKYVRVDGHVVAQGGALYTFQSQLSFKMADGGAKRGAVLDYDLNLFGSVRGLRLSVENKVVYVEGSLQSG